MKNKSLFIKQLFNHPDRENIINAEIDFFFFIQQLAFILFLYFFVFIVNFFDNSNILETLFFLFLGIFIYFYSLRHKILNRNKIRSNIRKKFISENVFIEIKRIYFFKIFKYTTSVNDIYNIILKNISLKEIYEILVSNNKLSLQEYNFLIQYLIDNKEKMNSSDIIYFCNLDTEQTLCSKLKPLINYAKDNKISNLKNNFEKF